MTIDKAKLKQLLSAQVSLHKVAKETETIEDENVYLNADDVLNEYLDDRGIYIEDVALALLAEIDQIKNEKEVLRNGIGAIRVVAGCPVDGKVIPVVDALRKDAERYRWLRNKQTFIWLIQDWFPGEAMLTNVDADIDAAMGKGEQP